MRGSRGYRWHYDEGKEKERGLWAYRHEVRQYDQINRRKVEDEPTGDVAVRSGNETKVGG